MSAEPVRRRKNRKTNTSLGIPHTFSFPLLPTHECRAVNLHMMTLKILFHMDVKWGSRRSAGLYPTWTCLLAFTLSRGPGVCHSGASCSWRADDMVRSWKSTDQSENGLAGSDNWISGFQDFRISGLWLNPYPVVHCSAEPLFAAKIHQ